MSFEYRYLMWVTLSITRNQHKKEKVGLKTCILIITQNSNMQNKIKGRPKNRVALRVTIIRH